MNRPEPPPDTDAHAVLNAMVEAGRGLLGSFAAWCAVNWQAPELGMVAEPDSPEYRRGWNEAVTTLDAAIECWLEEWPYG